MSKFFGNRLHREHLLLNPDPTGHEGGGNNPPPANDNAKIISDLQASNKALMERLEKLEKGGGNNPPHKKEDDDLSQKAEKERKAKEDDATRSKNLEAAMKFAIKAPDWVKENKSILPSTIEGIFTAADKENYGGAVEKANAIKVGIVSEFFAQQANQDLLTESQKNTLDEFKKLTKTVKEERVAGIYDSIFEPTFEMLKRLKKAEQVSKGHADPTDRQAAHKEKMIAASRKQYLKEKK